MLPAPPGRVGRLSRPSDRHLHHRAHSTAAEDYPGGGGPGDLFYKAYNYRSDRHSVLRRPFANRWLNLAIAWELALLALVVYLPALHEPFGTYALPFMDWLRINVLAATVVPVLELAKWMARRGWFGRMD